jgi:DNA-binding transcriptional MerR regulator
MDAPTTTTNGSEVGAPGLPISAVSAAIGVPVPTIRSWERRYGFPSPPRTEGRHRRYTQAEVDQLRDLRDHITRGYSAREAVATVRRARASDDGDAAAFVAAVVDGSVRMDPQAIRDALGVAAEALGVEVAVQRVALAGLREIGSRWAVGECDVANEHLATAAVHSWLARLQAMAPAPFRPGNLVLACGPKDLHTIGLEAFAVVLARRGWATRVLGAMTPAESLVSAVRTTRAVAVVVASQQNVTRRAAVDALRGVDRLSAVRTFYAGDAFASPASRRGVPGTYLGDDLLAAAAALEAGLSGVGHASGE